MADTSFNLAIVIAKRGQICEKNDIGHTAICLLLIMISTKLTIT